MKSKYSFITILLIALIGVGAYFVAKIPSPQVENSFQESELSDNIQSTEADTLGAETSTTVETGTEINMNEKLEITDQKIGTGIEAVAGKSVTVNYTGILTNGTVFDSNVDPKFNHVESFTFNLGAGEVIAGWDQGVAGMKVGGKRKLVIPPSLGYGPADLGAIPPNSTLIFDVELLKVE